MSASLFVLLLVVSGFSLLFVAAPQPEIDHSRPLEFFFRATLQILPAYENLSSALCIISWKSDKSTHAASDSA